MDIITRGLHGFTKGVLIDTATWATTAFIPDLASPTPVKIPGYAVEGIHWDDAISLGAGLGMSLYGVFKINTGTVIEGLGIMAGAFCLSRFQKGVASPW